MTPEDAKTLQEYLKAAAAILFKNTPNKEELKDFTSIELAVRDHILNEVAPEIGFFFEQQHCNDSRANQNHSD